jgi:hypothetical protein
LNLRPTNPQSHADKLAERDAAHQDAFLREVDDALREDQFVGLLRRYGRPVGAGIAAGLALLAGGLVWNAHRSEQADQRGETLTTALDQVEGGRLADATGQLGALTGGSDGSAAAARLLQAGVDLKQGKKAEAVKLFEAVAADSGAPQPYRDLATVRAVATNFDAMKPEDVVTRLKPLAVPGNPWFAAAGELVALAHARSGRLDLAGPLLGAIAKDKDAPESARARARQLAGQFGFDAVDDTAITPASARP